jgi:hypothetical protein
VPARPEHLGPVRAQLDIAGDESAQLFEKLGGPERVGIDQVPLIEGVTEAGVAERLTFALLLQRPTDANLISRLSSLVNVRQRGLAALGLGSSANATREDESIADYRRAIEAQRQRERGKASAPEAQGRAYGRSRLHGQ